MDIWPLVEPYLLRDVEHVAKHKGKHTVSAICFTILKWWPRQRANNNRVVFQHAPPLQFPYIMSPSFLGTAFAVR